MAIDSIDMKTTKQNFTAMIKKRKRKAKTDVIQFAIHCKKSCNITS